MVCRSWEGLYAFTSEGTTGPGVCGGGRMGGSRVVKHHNRKRTKFAGESRLGVVYWGVRALKIGCALAKRRTSAGFRRALPTPARVS